MPLFLRGRRLMRKRWVLLSATVVALSVAGSVGAFAFAGTSHTAAVRHTKRGVHFLGNVSRFCIYIDHRNGGDSYGDLSAVAKYGNKICVVGKRGAKGTKSSTGAAGD
jgi:hypothetical protein